MTIAAEPSRPSPLNRAIAAAQEVLFRKQHANGAWFAASDMDPVCTAQVALSRYRKGLER